MRHICIQTENSENDTEPTFYNVPVTKPTHVCFRSTNPPEHLVHPHHVWMFPVWTHQTIARLRLLVSPSVTQRHGQNRIREDSCCVPCTLCLSWEEKFANGTDTGSHNRETCSWPEFNTISGVICATACATPGRYNKLLCRATSQRWCYLWASCHARLIRGLWLCRHAALKI